MAARFERKPFKTETFCHWVCKNGCTFSGLGRDICGVAILANNLLQEQKEFLLVQVCGVLISGDSPSDWQPP